MAAPAPPPNAATPPGHDAELAELLERLHDDDGVDDVAAPGVGASLTKPTDVSRPKRVDVAPIESEGGIDFDPEYASFGARSIGLLIDMGILLLWSLPGIALIATQTTALALLGIVTLVAGFAASTVFYARAVARNGQSPGNRVASTKVVDVRNGRLVEPGEAGLRYFIRFTVSIIFFIGFFMAFGNAERRTFHDRIAGTVVTRPARERWSIDDEAAPTPTP